MITSTTPTTSPARCGRCERPAPVVDGGPALRDERGRASCEYCFTCVHGASLASGCRACEER